MSSSQRQGLSYSDPAGPFRAEQIREGDPYELSNGHAIRLMPASDRHGQTSLTGGAALDADPAVQGAGVEVGFSFDPDEHNKNKNLRAPDVSVGNVHGKPGFAQTAPPLAVEVADVGQDEKDLQDKIGELFAHGTQYIWVVRRTGPERVEVYEPGKKPRTHVPGQDLTAPGVLQNPVPVKMWFDRDVAQQVVLRNLLNRQGYQSLEDLRQKERAEGRDAGLRQAVLDACELLGIEVSEQRALQIEQADHDQLNLLRAELKIQRKWPGT